MAVNVMGNLAHQELPLEGGKFIPREAAESLSLQRRSDGIPALFARA
jgi:hypothetical protein